MTGLTQEQRAALHAVGLNDHDIDILKIRPEEVPKIVRELTREQPQKKTNGGGITLEPDCDAPSLPPEQLPPAAEPQRKRDGGGSPLAPDRAAPKASEAKPDSGGRLEPDRDQLEIFIEAVFRYCSKEGVVSLRAFFEDGGSKPFRITNISLKGGLKFLIEAAVDDAYRAANNPKPVVFCPPIAVFAPTGRAREQDLLEAPVFSVELDQNPSAALATLERLLGPATLVVRSGGVWVNPATGEGEDKLHGHWRLKQPARGENIIKLKQLRKLATALVGGDPSNVPACHPIRWPGSWHRKGTPRLCEIISTTDHLDNEIDLDAALAILQKAAGDGPRPESGDGFNVASKLSYLDPDEGYLGEGIAGASAQAEPERIAAALTVIPNSKRLMVLRGLKIDGSEDDNLDWHYWNAVGMATWNATSGSPEGKAAFHAWSKKSPKYNAQITDERWAAYFTSPPERIGAGTIFYLADQASPPWREEYEARKGNNQEESGGDEQDNGSDADGDSGSSLSGNWSAAFGKIISGEQFHPVLVPLASSFAARAVPEAAARGVLHALLDNTQTTDPGRLKRRGVELNKLKETVRSGYDKFAATPISGPLFDPWQEFIVPPFPLDILPGAAHDFVATTSIAMGADPASLAMAQLAAFSGAIHHRFRVKMMRNSDWYEHVRLWVLLFGPPSWLKSPIMEAALRPIRLAEADTQRDYKARLRTWKAQHKGKNSDGLSGEDEEPAPPERLLIGDTTIEKLGEIMSRGNRGMLSEHDELAGWIGRMERYHTAGKGASSDRAFYLRCWNGGSYTIDRVKSGEILVPNASLSILGGIQPKRLDELQGLTSDGLLQRFAITFMQAPKEPQDVDCTEVTNAYTALVYDLLKLPGQRFYLTERAADAMAELQRHLYGLERVGAALTEAFEGHIGKLKAYAGVFTLILHLIGNPTEAMKLTAIGRPAVEKAARLIKEFLLPHAYEFYGRCEGEGEQLRKIASFVLTCGKNRLRLADFTNNVRDCRGKKVVEINQQVSPLVAGDWLTPIDHGPACRAWRVNRDIIDKQFAARMASERQSKGAIIQLLRARRGGMTAGYDG
jgi:Protein of unknown function (DUF3987)/Primase C terminal 2 (PriCT-2)